MITIFKFFIDKEEELNSKSLGRIIRKFETAVKPELNKRYDYYNGKQEITRRTQEDSSRPNNRIVKNYCASIVDNFQGYLTGTPITYSGKDDNDVSPLLDIFDNNDIVNSDSEYLKNALTCGVAYQLCYINEKQEKRFKNVDSRNVIPIYSNDLDEELLYCIYYFPIMSWKDEISPVRYSINVYSAQHITHFESNESFNNIVVKDEPEQHYFNEVPFAIFNLNAENHSIFERVITLQDAYNKLLSDEVNDFEAFVDAYMVLKNVSATAEELAEMKASRTILLDGEDDVSYLTKNISDTQIQNILDNLNTSIHTVSNSPDFSSEDFNSGVSSGIALKFKLVGFNNIASNVEAQMRKSLQKRIKLLNRILNLVDTEECDVEISFNHNLPTSISETVEMVNGLRGLVSDETLLTQIPFIADVGQELDRINAEQAAFSNIYSFNQHEEEPESEV